MVAADTTTSSGNLFQWSTILWLKECFLNSSLELFLYSLRLCPINLVVVAFWNNWSELIFSLPVRILYVSRSSSLLRCNECNPSAFNLCSYHILLKPWTSFVDFLWIFSMHSISFLRYGFHLGGTTGNASDSRSEGRGFDSHWLTQCVSQLSGKPPGVNCRLWPATTPSSEL